MASPAPTSPAARLLGDRFSQLTAEVETLFTESCARGRQELADQLNQSVRRLRQCADLDELAATVVDAAAAFASGAALFLIEGGRARGRRIRGVPQEIEDAFVSLNVPLANAPALAGAVETRDPVTAVTSPAQVSKVLMDMLRHPAEGRVSIYPLVVPAAVPALLYTWGAVEVTMVELVAQVATAVWIGIGAAASEQQAAVPAADLVQIAAAAAPKPAWEELPAEEQQVHFRAQRFARVQVAEMRLHQSDVVLSGRAKRNLYDALRESIDIARQNFHDSFYPPCPSMVDYFHLELVRTLAHDDPELLGKDYPGPLA
jgi:hypothetical protein